VTAPGGHGTEYGVPIPTLAGPAGAAAFVDARIAEGSDYIKIIKDDGSTFGFQRPTLDVAALTAVVRAAHARHKLAIVHIATAQDARDAIAAGADGLAHVYAGEPDPEIAELAAARKVFWTPTLAVIAARESSREAALACVRSLHEAGVTILAGTDVPNPGTAHGESLHTEMALLVRAGLTPAQALEAATSAPAAAYGLDDRGLIAPGKRADLMLLAADPTRDIAATRNIAAIWKGGVLYTPRNAPPAVTTSTAPSSLVGSRPDFSGSWKLEDIVMTVRHRDPAVQYTAAGRRGALTVNESFAFTTDGAPPADTAKLGAIGQWDGAALVIRYVRAGKDLMRFQWSLSADGQQLVREATLPNGQALREVYRRQ
jgi:hypothetical protein